MAHMYIALVDTPGFFAALIRGFLRQRYIHVVIASDAELREAYSVGRRNPAVPVFAGFEKEDKNRMPFPRHITASASWNARRHRNGGS